MIHDLCSGHREPRSGAGDVCISGLGLGRAGFPYDHLEMEKINVRVAQLLVAACRQVLVVTSSSGGDNTRTPIGIHPDDHWRRHWLPNDYGLRLRYLRRTGLHCGYHALP